MSLIVQQLACWDGPTRELRKLFKNCVLNSTKIRRISERVAGFMPVIGRQNWKGFGTRSTKASKQQLVGFLFLIIWFSSYAVRRPLAFPWLPEQVYLIRPRAN